MKNFLYVGMILCLFNCAEKSSEAVSTKDSYEKYFSSSTSKNLDLAQEDIGFWEQKLQENPNDFVAKAKISSAYSTVFSASGNIEYLLKAEKYLLEVNEKTNYNNAGYLRSLAHNYISQHRFKEALDLMEKAETNGEKLRSTKKMLFDVHLELGNIDQAEAYLEDISNMSDFDYLIRLAKWQDHKGDLDSAIKYMEKAMGIAESSNLPSTKQWVYTNIADFYGHAGRIDDSYDYFLKALEIDPEDAYAKKGLAWIVYSHEDNPEEALKMLSKISAGHKSPDYDLLMSEIESYRGEEDLSKDHLDRYLKAIAKSQYGAMYNKYKVLIYAEDEDRKDEALQIALEEVEHRPTAQSYDLLAWAYFKNGDIKKATVIIDDHVIDKTFEPEAMYHIAEIYKAAGRTDEVKPIKADLLESLYELGPHMASSINKL